MYQHATAFVFAGIEDFGISFVEAQACGTPVLAYKKGGVLDIVSKDTGFLFEQQSADHIIDAVNKIKKMDFKPSIIRKNSIKFSRESFKKNFEDYMNNRL